MFKLALLQVFLWSLLGCLAIGDLLRHGCS
jgi:hypothetical protein